MSFNLPLPHFLPSNSSFSLSLDLLTRSNSLLNPHINLDDNDGIIIDLVVLVNFSTVLRSKLFKAAEFLSALRLITVLSVKLSELSSKLDIFVVLSLLSFIDRLDV